MSFQTMESLAKDLRVTLLVKNTGALRVAGSG